MKRKSSENGHRTDNICKLWQCSGCYRVTVKDPTRNCENIIYEEIDKFGNIFGYISFILLALRLSTVPCLCLPFDIQAFCVHCRTIVIGYTIEYVGIKMIFLIEFNRLWSSFILWMKEKTKREFISRTKIYIITTQLRSSNHFSLNNNNYYYYHRNGNVIYIRASGGIWDKYNNYHSISIYCISFAPHIDYG